MTLQIVNIIVPASLLNFIELYSQKNQQDHQILCPEVKMMQIFIWPPPSAHRKKLGVI